MKWPRPLPAPAPGTRLTAVIGMFVALGCAGVGTGPGPAARGGNSSQAICDAIPAGSSPNNDPGCTWLQTWATPGVNITPNATQAYFPAIAAQTFGTTPGNIVIPGVAISQAVAPPADTTNTAARFANTTIRQIVRVSVGGSRIRLRLSNVATPEDLTIDELHVARWDRAACAPPLPPVSPATVPRGPACSNIVMATDTAVTLGGRRAVTVPANGVIYTDPVILPVPALGEVAISMYFRALTPPLTLHVFGGNSSYRVVGLPGTNGNFVGATAFDASTLGAQAALAVGTNRMVVDGLDVWAPNGTRGIIAVGDSITDGANSTPDTHTRWSDFLAERLIAAQTASGGRWPPGVSHAGIGGNRVVTDAAAQFGPNLVSRFERDVLSRSGVTDVIVLEGVNDIGQSPTFTETPENIIAAYRILIQRAHDRGLKIYFGTIAPIRSDQATAAGTYGGLFSQSQALFELREPRRQAVNRWILTTREHDGAIDFNAALSAPGLLDQIHAPYTLNMISGSNDQLHPNSSGYRAMANRIDLRWFTFADLH